MPIMPIMPVRVRRRLRPRVGPGRNAPGLVAILLALLVLLTLLALLVTIIVGFWPKTLGGRVSYVMVSGTSMAPGLHTGDLVVTRAQPRYEAGAVVAFRVRTGEPGEGNIVIHRVVGGNEVDGFTTQGDNRSYRDPWTPTRDDILGEQWMRVPGVGGWVGRLRAPIPLGLFCGLLTVWVLAPRRPRLANLRQ